MILTPYQMRMLLSLCLIGIVILSMLYLRKRKLATEAYVFWGLLVILFPLIGTTLVIALQPGHNSQSREKE